MPEFTDRGYLPPGKWPMTWPDFNASYGFNNRRTSLLSGLRLLLLLLADCGCQVVYIGGSFVTDRSIPAGIDGCFDAMWIDFQRLDPIFRDLEQQYRRFDCGFRLDYMSHMLGFLQTSHDGEPVGVVELSFTRADLNL
jgi:hypothetical protein